MYVLRRREARGRVRAPTGGHVAPGEGSRFNPGSFFSLGLAVRMKAYMCVICGYVYEEEKGDPGSGIAAGTRWEDVPLSWRCPDCGAGKEDFEMIEV